MQGNFKEKRDTIKACKRYIDAHIREPLDLVSLARRHALSYNAFREAFKDVADYTPHKYIRLRRVQLAAQALREGDGVTDAAELVGFETLAGFYKAFLDIYGVSPQEFRSTRGTALMPQPRPVERPDAFIVGYVLTMVDDMRPGEHGAYWIVKEFPTVSGEDYARIGGGADMAAAWTGEGDDARYIMGPPVAEVRFVPEHMEALAIPGGAFLEFPVPGPSETFVLYESIRATWYFARHQWLPESGYAEDPARTAFEYYGEDGNSIFIPVKEEPGTA